MSDGLNQITIPDFDDDELNSTSIPFGRPTGFGFGSNSGQESPTHGFSNGDRSYFHSRGDSVTSEDSNHSFQQTPSRSNGSYANSSQTSIATASSVPKKASFASLRNAFKSSKPAEAPPVPQIDRQVYPAALKNPFNRSTSSLAQPIVPIRRPSVTASPPHPRPSTPGASASDLRHARAPSYKSRGHAPARSQHSRAGSAYQNSEGSDHSHALVFGTPKQSQPPPVPRVPNEYVEYGGNAYRNGTPSFDIEEEKIVIDPRTPSDYALHAVFMRFATAAEMKIDNFLRQGIDRDPPLAEFLGAGVDTKFDDVLQSLGRIAMKNAKPVVDSIMRWRKTQNENASGTGDVIRLHSSDSYSSGRGVRPQEIINVLNERRSLASIFIMCRALIVVMQSLSKDALGETIGHSLEETTFEQFKRPDLRLLSQSANHRTNAELYATLLGQISNLRFVSVTDRFLAELGPVAQGQVPKDLDMKYENLVKGLRHVQIKVWPPESFEDGAEFLESLSKSFEHAHGLRLKTSFAETLVHLLHPIGKTAQAEVNHPLWAKAIETIYPKARDMMSKPRYWHVAYPLVVTSLCVAPHEYFLRHWISCFEVGLSKLKEKPFRIPVMNGIMRLVWTYLYRCHEPTSTSTSKLETLLKHLFPPNRVAINPPDDHLDPFVYIVHFVLSRHFDFGCELTLNLMQEQQIRAAPTSNIINLLAPERTNIALEAILLSLHMVEREEPAPAWPSNSDFSVVPSKEDYPSSSDPVPSSFMTKPGMQEFFDRCGSTVSAIAYACARSVGRFNIFDDQWSLSRLNVSYEETTNYIIRQHTEANVAYLSNLTPQITVLHTCFSSWPRCLHPTLPVDDALDMLIYGLIHIEPAIGEAASSSIQRFAVEPTYVANVLARFSVFLFSPNSLVGDGSNCGTRLPFESSRLINTWFSAIEIWAASIQQKVPDTLDDSELRSIASTLLELESGTLFLLSYSTRMVRSIGVKIIRIIEALVSHLEANLLPPDGVESCDFHVLDSLLGHGVSRTFFDERSESLDGKQRARLLQWRGSSHADVVLRIAESTDDRDRILWRHVFPSFVRRCLHHQSNVVQSCRELWSAAVTRYHPIVASVSGINNRLPVGPARSPAVVSRERERTIAENQSIIEQWHIWVKLVCCTASTVDSKSTKREHTRAPSDLTYERDRMTTTRGLFRYLTPFLDADHSIFRDTAVMCVSSFPSSGYSQLLEDLSTFAARHFYDDSRTKVSSPPSLRRNRRQDRLYLAVAHIYQITAHYLKDQRGAGRQDSLTNVLKFVRHTQAFLSSYDIRGDWQQQRLRRYFCGIVEHLFDGLSSLQSSDRFIPPNMHLTLYRLCEEWCQCGTQSTAVKQRLVAMQTAATAGYLEPQLKASAIERFQTETVLLSHAAVGAMASLCQKAFFPPELSSGSPTDRASADFLAPLEAGPTLDRLVSMLASIHQSVNESGRKALKSLLSHRANNETFVDEVLRRSFVTSKETKTSNCRFFEIVAGVVCHSDVHPFSFGHIFCISMANLCSPLKDTRRQAFSAIEALHLRVGGTGCLAEYEAAVLSSAPNIYLDAQHRMSECLAQHHPDETVSVLTQCSARLPVIQELLPTNAASRVLQGLVPWLLDIRLMEDGMKTFSSEGRTVLYHMLALTMRYSDSQTDAVQALWGQLVREHPQNGQGTIMFLLEQSSKIGSTAFVHCAKQIVACLSRTSIGRQIFEELIDVIEPARMLPSIEHKLMMPNPVDTDLWSDLDALFAEQPRHTLGAGQFALLFLADVVPTRAWEFKKQLPTLLHAIFSHLDHRNPMLREHARIMLFQVLRSWLPGYNDIDDQSLNETYLTIKSTVNALEREADSAFWMEEDPISQTIPKMKQLCSSVIQWLAPVHPTLINEWGSLALVWGTACSIRSIAFRSLQIFRAVMSRVTQADLALLLGRLTNTVAGPDTNIHLFTAELILTLRNLAEADNLDQSLVPTLFWCAYACLSTPVEAEFGEIVEFLDCLLDRLDLDDAYTTEVLLSQKPSNWLGGSIGLQPLLLPGLRSVVTYQRTFKVLQRLAQIEASTLIDDTGHRVRDMYTLCLPWCLRAMEDNKSDEDLVEYANNVGQLAEESNLHSIARIMTSFVKTRFRTKDDFLRQAAAALREHYASQQWTEVVSLLLSLVLNQEQWLRIKSIQILKVVFQLRETRNPVDRLGSELLMPLLRLLTTDLAAQALEVLDEPMAISGGPNAKQVLRMSMHMSTLPNEVEDVTEVFGMPEESGWCIANPDRQREITRSNVMAVFDTCKVPTRPSRIEFHPEVDAFAFGDTSGLANGTGDALEADLGDLVQNLHELSTFFQDESQGSSNANNTHGQMNGRKGGVTAQAMMPSHQLEARVAAILAKSTDAVAPDMPQTPYVDVFRIEGREYDESDDESESDYDTDTFAYDNSISGLKGRMNGIGRNGGGGRGGGYMAHHRR
ncbi:hypothetical protein BD410DRAFT_896782 [Rickenella mellea]|uniref:Cell morphogenesis protein n=1 Tax=Rickenella mellea TaxID=50990 RepID=A0A4Y7QBE2_9AGAM|nr:hypothetical protein BD410DRAFT_896782 [Rickenella mellea]